MKKHRSGLGILAALSSDLTVLSFTAILVVCLILGFGVHTFGGLLTLYISLGLQILNILILLLRRHAVLKRFSAPPPSRKMRIFRNVNIAVWCCSVAVLLAAVPMDLFWLGSSHPAVIWMRIMGAILSPLSWIGMFASYYRRRPAALLSRR